MEMTEHERKRNSVRLCFINPLTTHRVAFPPFTVSALSGFLFHLTCALISRISIRLISSSKCNASLWETLILIKTTSLECIHHTHSGIRSVSPGSAGSPRRAGWCYDDSSYRLGLTKWITSADRVAARHNFPITHHSWQRLSQQKARGPSIQSVQIDPPSVFACDCVKTKRGESRAKRERASI